MEREPTNLEIINELLRTNYSGQSLTGIFDEVTGWSAGKFENFQKLFMIVEQWLAIKAPKDAVATLMEVCRLGLALGTARERYKTEIQILEKMMK